MVLGIGYIDKKRTFVMKQYVHSLEFLEMYGVFGVRASTICLDGMRNAYYGPVVYNNFLTFVSNL